MKRLKRFNTDQQYAVDKAEQTWPSVSWIEDSDDKLKTISLYEKYSKEYLTFEALESGTFSFSGVSIDYSIDNGETWTTIESETNTPTIDAGNTIMFKTMIATTENGIGTFSSTGRFNVMGNVYSIGFGDDFEDVVDISERGSNYLKSLFADCIKLVSAKYLILQASTLSTYCYSHMFEGCSSLIETPYLPAMTLADYCYAQMFKNCTSLESVYILPAMTLAACCYSEMFMGCSSLTKAPILPATTLTQSCYGSMFYECTSLKTPPKLPATTFSGNNVYQYMFFGCSSLTTAPVLPATTLKPYCYQYMFFGCTSLTTPPTLPATTLTTRCYYYMFRNCRSLITAPILPATGLTSQCYVGMFMGCSNISYIKAMFTTTPSNTYTNNWVNGVSATGTFVKKLTATWTTIGTNAVPSGWDILTATV